MQQVRGPLARCPEGQHISKGNILQGLTYEASSSFGWATYDNDKGPCLVTFLDRACDQEYEAKLPWPKGVMEGMKPVLVENLTLGQVRLEDEEAGFSQVLAPLLQKQHTQHTLKQDDKPIEMPEAAAEFKDVVAPAPEQLHAKFAMAASPTHSSSKKQPSEPSTPPPKQPPVASPPGNKPRASGS